MSEHESESDPYEVIYNPGESNESSSYNYLIHPHGIAKATFPNGDTYTGEYKNKQRNGKGVYTWANKDDKPIQQIYDGEYVDNKRSGFGTITYIDKSSYIGEWQNNMKHGNGTYTYPNGDKYTGEWINNQRHGTGVYVYASDSSEIAGQWAEGKLLTNKGNSATWSFYEKKLFQATIHNGKVTQYKLS